MRTLIVCVLWIQAAVVASAACAISASGAWAAERRPNVLFILADDQRADTIGAHGNPHIRTPHLDRLAARGFSFRRNYVFGGNSGAVCVPSRAMIMTGKTWFQVDAPTLKGERLLPELFGEQGYATFATGKWHNGQASWLRAFQRGQALMFGGMSDHTRVPVRDLGPDGKLTEERWGESFSSELFADAAIRFLRSHKEPKPFFAYVALTAPHDPRQPPKEFRDPYYRDPPPLPPDFLPQLPFDNGMMDGGRDENLGAWPRTESMIREQLAEYYGLVTHMDVQIGRILRTLEETGHADQTLIVFAADNGLALGSHGLLGKQSVFEHSMRTPLIIAGPGVPAGQSSQAFTYLFDLFPTLLDAAGMPMPDGLAGHSLRPVWEGRRDRVRESVFLPFLQHQRSVRDEQFKLIVYPKIGYAQLFDLKADPHETRNIAGAPESGARIERLRESLVEWQTRVGDRVVLPEKLRFEPPTLDLTGKPRKPDVWQPRWIVEKYFGDGRVTTDEARFERQPLWRSGTDGYHTYRIPSLLVTPQQTVLAFCEGRKTSASDHGDLDLLMKRSQDGGRSWSPQSIVYEEGGDAPVTIGNPCPVLDRKTGKIQLLFCRDNRQVLQTTSADEGQTWSRPRDLSATVVQADWQWVATGPGVGIQLRKGRYAGRLVVPCDHKRPARAAVLDGKSIGGKSVDGKSVDGKAIGGQAADGKSVDGKSVDGKSVDGKSVDGKAVDGKSVDGKSVDGKAVDGKAVDGKAIGGQAADGKGAAPLEMNSHMMLSDDGGETWRISRPIGVGGNECQVVELADGTLLVNTRMQGDFRGYRGTATSADGGETWTRIVHEAKLPCPKCQGSLVAGDPKSADDARWLLFSNPSPPARMASGTPSGERVHLTVRASVDEGRSWTHVRRLHHGPSAYSCLATLDHGDLLCLYEGGDAKPYETLFLVRFNTQWLRDGDRQETPATPPPRRK